MVIIRKETVGAIPLLHIVEDNMLNEKLPLVIFIHGFESIKERNVQYAYMLADKGYRVLLPDALYHGERAEGNISPIDFWKITLNTIYELSLIKDEYVSRELVEENRIGLAGTSMGAIVTLGAMKQYDWVRAVVSLMGTPSYVEFAKYQLHLMEQQGITLPYSKKQIEEQLKVLLPYDATEQIDHLELRPLMFWHGAKDSVVPYQQAYAFYEQLVDKFKKDNIPLTFILDEQAGHNVPNKGVVATVNWFVEHL